MANIFKFVKIITLIIMNEIIIKNDNLKYNEERRDNNVIYKNVVVVVISVIQPVVV